MRYSAAPYDSDGLSPNFKVSFFIFDGDSNDSSFGATRRFFLSGDREPAYSTLSARVYFGISARRFFLTGDKLRSSSLFSGEASLGVSSWMLKCAGILPSFSYLLCSK